MSTLSKAIILGIFFGIISIIAGLSYAAPWKDVSWQLALVATGSFGCFGFLIGGIYAFDPESELKIKSSAIGRMSFGLIAALIFSALWRLSLDAVVLVSVIGAALGYFGMIWAKIVEFL